MTCQLTPGCDNPCEGNTNGCASCNHAARKAERLKYKPAKQFKRIKGGKNLYECSDGSKVTQNEIDRRLSAAYRDKYPSQNMPCAGCGQAMAHGSAHIIAQSRLKKIRKTELIWHPELFFPGCIECNAAIENPKGEAWKSLLNIQECLTVIKKHDSGLFQKFMNNTDKYFG